MHIKIKIKTNNKCAEYLFILKNIQTTEEMVSSSIMNLIGRVKVQRKSTAGSLSDQMLFKSFLSRFSSCFRFFKFSLSVTNKTNLKLLCNCMRTKNIHRTSKELKMSSNCSINFVRIYAFFSSFSANHLNCPDYLCGLFLSFFIICWQ